MIPVQSRLVLNHVPLVGLVFELIFSVLGIKRMSPQAYLAGLHIFLGIGVITTLIVLSGLRSADLLYGAPWIDATAVAQHRRVGIMTLAVLLGVSAFSGTIWGASSDTPNLRQKVLVCRRQFWIERASIRRSAR
jgi:hypothetical protein